MSNNKTQETFTEVPTAKPSFFKRWIAKVDASMKEKAEAKSKQGCCGSNKKGGGSGGSCC